MPVFFFYMLLVLSSQPFDIGFFFFLKGYLNVILLFIHCLIVRKHQLQVP